MRLQKILVQIFYVVGGGIFLWLILNIVLNQQYVLPISYGGNYIISEFYNPLILLFIVTLIFIAAFFAYRILQKAEHFKVIPFVLFGIIVSIQIYFGIVLAFDISDTSRFTDMGVIIEAAEKILDGESYMGEYFKNTPYQIGILTELVLWHRFWAFLGSTSLNANSIALNIVSIDLAILGSFLLVKEVFGSKAKANLLLIFACMFTPYFTYVAYYYTDTLSLPFAIWAIYVYARQTNEIREWKKMLNALLIGGLFAQGIFIKASVGIALVAILIHMVLQKVKIEKVIEVEIILLTIVIFQFAAYRVIDRQEWFPYKVSQEKGYPKEFWLLMGTNEDRLGAYPPDDVMAVLSKYSYEGQREAAVTRMTKRLQEYGLAGYIKFLTQKNTWMWGDGKYFASEILNSMPHLKESGILTYFIKDASGSKVFCYWSQGFHILMMLLIFLSYKKGKEEKSVDIKFVVNLTIFGTLLFFSLWESRPRYLINMSPVFLVSSIDGLDYFISKIRGGKKLG